MINMIKNNISTWMTVAFVMHGSVADMAVIQDIATLFSISNTASECHHVRND